MRALRAMVPTAGLFLSLSLTAFIGECSYAATTFGTAILFQIGWEISYICGVGDGRVSGAVVNLAVAEVFMAPCSLSTSGENFTRCSSSQPCFGYAPASCLVVGCC